MTKGPAIVKCPHCERTGRKGSIGTHVRYVHGSVAEYRKKFFARVDKNAPKGCWLWTGALNKEGYGAIRRHKKFISAHRLSWVLTHGEPADGLWVLHNCDVRNCCNPKHLRLGTVLDNARDVTERGRKHHRYEPVEKLLHPHLSRRVRGGKGCTKRALTPS